MGKTIGELIKKYRKRSNLTLPQLDSSLRNQICILDSEETINQWESGIYKPGIEIIEALAVIFNLNEFEKVDFFKAASDLPEDEPQATRQHDARIFHDGNAIFNESDLRKLINQIYSEYQYQGSQSDKLVELINFLALESSRYIKPELAYQSERLRAYLNSFLEFLNHNFHQDKQTEDGDKTYLLTTMENGFETESFLIELQMLSMDVENAYRNYRSAFSSKP